ncbi:hypothetical protein T439DRAFT_10684 [Meredithblackwellia eburnea MCA 4105]
MLPIPKPSFFPSLRSKASQSPKPLKPSFALITLLLKFPFHLPGSSPSSSSMGRLSRFGHRLRRISRTSCESSGSRIVGSRLSGEKRKMSKSGR